MQARRCSWVRRDGYELQVPHVIGRRQDRTEKGKRMPIDLERREEGRIVLVHDLVREPPLVKVLSDEKLEQARRQHAYRVKQGMEEEGPFRLFVPHFATCPDAGRHRKRGRR